jgi:hypothetical protein
MAISEKQIKGIDLAVRATKKVFPFIKGWEFTPDWEKYSTVIYINLIVDFVELGKTMDMEVKSYFFYKFKIYGEFTTSAILAPFEWGEYESEQWKDMSQASLSLAKKIRGTLKQAYEFIPDEMSIFNNVSSSSFKPSLVAEDYIQRTNPLATT